MDRFSIEELNLMCIYDTGTRSGLISGLKKSPWSLLLKKQSSPTLPKVL